MVSNFKIKQHLWESSFLTVGKYINLICCRQIIKIESAEKLTLNEKACLCEDQKHTLNVAKIQYQKLSSENLTMRATRIILYAKGFLNMVMVVLLLLNDPSFKLHPSRKPFISSSRS